jgi:DNA-binding HxlR family transcriptional regulator
MRTPEQKLATKLRQLAERNAHRARVFKKHPPSVRYAKRHFKKGRKAQKKNRQPIKLGLQ